MTGFLGSPAGSRDHPLNAFFCDFKLSSSDNIEPPARDCPRYLEFSSTCSVGDRQSYSCELTAQAVSTVKSVRHFMFINLY